MSALHIAPLPAAQDAAALALLDQAFADDPTLGWYLFGERPGFDARRSAYLASYQAFHRENQLPTLAAWRTDRLVAVCYFSMPGQHASAASLARIGAEIRQQCGDDCLARLDQLLAAFDQHLDQAECARIEFIGTAANLQGQGIGSALLDECLVQLKASGCAKVALETAAPRNLTLYQRRGFVQSGHLQLPGLRLYYLQVSLRPGR
jgi:GNAT superfamily N-acetyltransferase